ncbi:MAG: VTT domain-containing protein [Actinomycetota bacterium]|nr:VTT domain-containing protein [Actinomycetota bacterium]
MLLLAALIAAITAVVSALGVGELARLRIWVDQAGWLGPALFAAAFALLTLAPLPKNALSAAAGLLFGLLPGIVVVMAGATAGAVAAFALARLLGREVVERWAGARVARVDALLRRRGVWGVLVARLVPLMPFTVINYGSGLSAVRFRDYLLGTVVGILPGTTAYVALGAYGRRPSSWQFATAVVALLAMTVGGFLWARRARHRPLPCSAAGGRP